MKLESGAHILWLSDPWGRLDHSVDTTVRLVRESIYRGNHNYITDCNDIVLTSVEGARVLCSQVMEAELSRSPVFQKPQYKDISQLDAIMLRKDPPITWQYLNAIQIISAALIGSGIDPESRIFNPPSVLLTHNSKLLALSVGDTPRTIISCSSETLLKFIHDERIVVLKPLSGHEGSGIHLVRRSTHKQELEDLIRKLTASGSRCILAQQYLENYLNTEKRVWFIDGQILEAGKKQFNSKQFPPRLRHTEYIVRTALDRIEIEVCTRLGQVLRDRRIRLAGVDIIDKLLTDVNVVSPGLLVEIEQVTSKNLASQILSTVERSVPG